MDITAGIIIWEWGLTGEWKGSKKTTSKRVHTKSIFLLFEA